MSNYGCKPPRIAPFHYSSDLWLPWILFFIATSVPVIWECIADSVAFDGHLTWHGWLLSFAAKNVLEGYTIKTKRFQQPHDNPYAVLSKSLHLCWNLNSKNNSIEQPPAGYAQYKPIFTLSKLHHCLSQVKTFEVFQTLMPWDHHWWRLILISALRQLVSLINFVLIKMVKLPLYLLHYGMYLEIMLYLYICLFVVT